MVLPSRCITWADLTPFRNLLRHSDFVNGIEFKEDLKKLNAHYSALPEDVLKTGLINFAAYPSEDTTFLTTQLWDKYLPRWRTIRPDPKRGHDPTVSAY